MSERTNPRRSRKRFEARKDKMRNERAIKKANSSMTRAWKKARREQ